MLGERQWTEAAIEKKKRSETMREAYPVGLKVILPFHIPFQSDDYRVATPDGVMNVSLLEDPQAHKRQTKNQQYLDEANSTVIVTFDGVSEGVHSEGRVVVEDLALIEAFFKQTIEPLTDSVVTSGDRSICISRIPMQAGIRSGNYQQKVDYSELAVVFHLGTAAINRFLSVMRVATSYFVLPLINEDYSQSELTSSGSGLPLYYFHKTGDVREASSFHDLSDRYLEVEDDDYKQVVEVIASGEETLLDNNRFIIEANAAFFQGDYQTAIVLLQIQLEYELSREMKREGLVIPEKEGLGKKFIVPLVDAKKSKEWIALKQEWDNYNEWKNNRTVPYQEKHAAIGAWIQSYILRNEIVHEGKAVSRKEAIDAFLAYMAIFMMLFRKEVYLPRPLSFKIGGTFG